MEATERCVYEKILAAHVAAAENPRLGVDEFLRRLLSAEERATEAYLTFDYLQGRSPEFAPFLARALGYADEAEARADVAGKYAQAIRGRLDWYQQTGR